ncbi:hypothetical protein MLD38_009415 [Melastoma candidum]|uniref:Uncharacterized protein n=1 Tax=Melastoma candidum TaxID=119954 RepID=A0ACB9S175_9MYRT|nr:hypothetical protein MLD38_009415 [Melastoma candidum]
MAAGRHGGYRGSEFREREANSSSSRELGYRDRVREGGHRARIRQKEVENGGGGYGSYSSGSDSGGNGGKDPGNRHQPNSVRNSDREPGELSSESGSEDAIELNRGEECEKLENGVNSSPVVEKKRKFSPIVWDRDDEEASAISKRRTSTIVAITRLPPPPPLPMSFVEVPKSDNGGVEISSVQTYATQVVSSAVDKVDSDLIENSRDSPAVDNAMVALPSGDDRRGAGQEAQPLEDEDYVPLRNISSSRWASGDSSPIDEGEIVDHEAVHTSRRGSKLRGKSVTPEAGNLKKDGSEDVRLRSNESGSQSRHTGSSSEERYSGHDLDGNDYMEIDVDRDNYMRGDGALDTDSEEDRTSERTPEPASPPRRTVNMFLGCRSVDEFERLNKIDEGTYGVVFRARDKKTGEVVALKKVKMEKEREGFPLTSLREINILLSFHHPSIVDVKEVVVGSNLDSIYMVMEYMEHDLKGLMEAMKQPFSQSEVKCLMLQLLEGVKYLHDNWVLHRDLKTSNLLLNNRGELKICDFGLARQYGSPLKPYTPLVVTLWYRAPELLLGAKQYSTAIDMWSLGCIMAELLSKEPLFNGKTEFEQLDKIFRILGTPNETIWPGFSKLPGVKVNFIKHQYNMLRKKFPPTSFTGSPVLSDAGFDLLNKLLTYDPEKRITADDALNHEWFREVPHPKSKDFMPTFPAQHDKDRRTRRLLKSPDPLEEQRRKELQQGELGGGGLFG